MSRLILCSLLCLTLDSFAGSAVALFGAPKSQFSYIDRDSRQGGVLRLGVRRAFDSLNPYSIIGIEPAGVLKGVIETLAIRAKDQLNEYHGHLAVDIQLDPQFRHITFVLDPRAQFADGKSVSAKDVEFSVKKLSENSVRPEIRSVFSQVKRVEKLGAKKVRLHLKKPGKKELLALCELPVLAQHFYSKDSFAKGFSNKILGSGPYLVKKFQPGQQIVLEKRKDYWAKGVERAKGTFNFERVEVTVYRDKAVWLEGFKSGKFDFAYFNTSKLWAKNTSGPLWDQGKIKKTVWTHNMSSPLVYALNNRRWLFQSEAVRRALITAFDFDWTNRSLLYSLYIPFDSYFFGSEFQAGDSPSTEERAVMKELKIPEPVWQQGMKRLASGSSKRERLKKAKEILSADGWKLVDGVLQKEGRRFEFRLLLDSTGFVRLSEPYFSDLARLGIRAQVEVVDSAVFHDRVHDFKYDMIVRFLNQTTVPGPELKGRWSRQASQTLGSENFMGVSSPLVDQLLEKIASATSLPKIKIYAKVLDRVLWNGHYAIPLWTTDAFRIGYWNRFSTPETKPKYYMPIEYIVKFASIQTVAP